MSIQFSSSYVQSVCVGFLPNIDRMYTSYYMCCNVTKIYEKLLGWNSRMSAF